MKKLYIILLFFTGLTGFAFSPPVINQPAPYQVCDDNNDGFGAFDLTTVIPQVLGGQNPALFTVTFHETGTEAELGANPIVPTNAYINTTAFTQTVFIRVVENANPTEYSLTSLQLTINPTVTASIVSPQESGQTFCGQGMVMFEADGDGGNSFPYQFSYITNGGAVQTVSTSFANYVNLGLPEGVYDIMLTGLSYGGGGGCAQVDSTPMHIEVTPGPNAGEPQDLFVEQIPYVNSANFNLTINTPLLINGDPNLTVTYYTSSADAEANTNPILATTNYLAYNGQFIWARVQNTDGCFVLRTFNVYVTNPDIVFIPDANFKSALVTVDFENPVAQDLNHNFTVVDANGDGEIQYTEAENISLLNVSQRGIRDLTGLEAFVNMGNLNVSNNLVIGVPNTAMPLLTDLFVGQCNMYSLDLSNNPNLRILDCNHNNLSTLNLSTCPLLEGVAANSNRLTSINLAGLTSLTNLALQNNQLTSIDTSHLNSIVQLNVGTNSITALDLTGLGALEKLYCYENDIDSLNTADSPNLDDLVCAANQMTYLDVSHSTALTNLDCSNNTFINLDLGSNSALCTFNCAINYSLVTLNIKNGVDSCYTNFIVTDITNSLQQFCCDDNEVTYFKNYFLNNQGIDVNVNSYCSFTPGGDYNTIAVNTQLDANNNGCDVNDSGYPNIRLNITDGTNQGASFTNANGGGFFYTQAGNFTITPSIEHPTWFSSSPASANIQFSNTNNNTSNQNFCIVPVGVHPDLEIVIAPLTSARPGFDVYYNIVVKNKGNQTLNHFGDGIVLTYDSDRMSLLETSVPLSLSEAGNLTWDLTDLAPFESRTILLRMNVNPPTHPTHPVNIGDVLPFDATVNPTAGDEVPSDNTFHYNHVVIGSYDPNEIVCLEGTIVSPIEIGNYLHYTINFENTGNADAENVVVRDTINPAQFDINSLQLLGSSASVTTRISGNVAEFIFPSINLHSGGHGNILLKVRTNAALNEGDTVSKTANIYFDYNFPVTTDPENTTFQTLSNPDIPTDASVSVYPNPTKGNVNISCSNTIKSVALYDVQGRLLQTGLVNENKAAIDLSGNSNGVYFVKIISDKGMKVQKIVKE